MALPEPASSVSSAWKIIPQFQSRSINKTVRFYVEELGFILGGTHPDDDGEGDKSNAPEPTFCSLFAGHKAAANIYFNKCEPNEFQPREAMIALDTEGLDEFYGVLKARNTMKIVEPIEDKEWGYRQFSVADADGNILTFFKFLQGGNPGEE